MDLSNFKDSSCSLCKNPQTSEANSGLQVCYKATNTLQNRLKQFLSLLLVVVVVAATVVVVSLLIIKLARPRGYKTFFMLNSTEHEIFLLINVKMPINVLILTFMSGKIAF